MTNVLRVGVGPLAVTFAGPGAGRDVTAATILDDLVEVSTGRALTTHHPQAEPCGSVVRDVPASAWFFAIDRVSSDTEDFSDLLAAHHLTAVSTVHHAGQFAAITEPAPAITARAAAGALAARGLRTVWFPVLDESIAAREPMHP